MSLWLSRIAVNPMSAQAMKLLGDPSRLHSVIYGLFDLEVSGRILFRVDSDPAGPSVLIQSGTAPDWDKLPLGPADLRAELASKPLDLTLLAGQELSFRLLARPARRTSTGKGNPPGPRPDFRTDEERLEWLRRKGKDGGWKLTTCQMTILSFAAVKSEIAFRAKGGSFTAVQFDGVLVVTDPDKLREAVRNGIGPQKAYGFGLLSLAIV